MAPDFSRLYSHLGLPTDCDLAALKRAYRRRVAQLHPDRPAAAAAAQEDAGEFAELISLYGSAIRFHRLHGRLPGEPATPRPALRMPGPLHASFPNCASDDERSGPPPRLAGKIVIMLALAGVLLIGYEAVSPVRDAPPAVHVDSTAMHAAEAELEASRMTSRLAVGMEKERVLEIQGLPTRQGDSLWEYGPSWIRFHRGRVVEWYSSPLYRLNLPEERDSSR